MIRPLPTGLRSRLLAALLFQLTIASATLQAGTVTVAWDPNSETDLAGYVVSWGTQSGVYTHSKDVGNIVLTQVTGLVEGQRYYFVVQAYNTSGLMSPYSNEVSTVVASSGPAPPSLTVTGVQPTYGPVAGGTALTIKGTGFAQNATVTFGGVPAASVLVLDPTTITAVSPPNVRGRVTVVVRNPDGTTGAKPNGFAYLDDEPTADADGDGLPDPWEVRYGLDPSDATGVHGALGDPDGDGVTNADEFRNGTHPRGLVKQYFAEGVDTTFFATEFALLNPSDQRATVVLGFLKSDGTQAAWPVDIEARRRVTVRSQDIAPLRGIAFSTVVESDWPVVVDRKVIWDRTGYGGHAETAIAAPSTVWYLAEGATHSGFDLFYLLQNPNPQSVEVEVRYLLPRGEPIVKTYTLPPASRYNIWVDLEDPRLSLTDVSAVITSLGDLPIIVERSMYLNAAGQPFGAGHNSAGVTAPATRWFLAEGATGDFFDLFVLIANPTPQAADVVATYLLPSGQTIEKRYPVPGNSRFNIWVDYEDQRLASTAVSTTIESVNGAPIIVERTMWWPGLPLGGWLEAHNAPGATSTATRWAVASGEQGGEQALTTYLLLANTSATPGQVRVTLLYEDGSSEARTFAVAGRSRFNVAVEAEFPAADGRRFGALIESLGDAPAELVVECATYWNAGGVIWAAGTNALGTPLPASTTVTQSATSTAAPE